MKKNYMYIEIIIYLKNYQKIKLLKYKIVRKDRNSRISNVREAKVQYTRKY